ncbi:hypothetical protein NDU88_000498 [Pleurodeles waltl]|uniref:Uncharacterized protein n=1 Tax=Pleurodeles waltl TaxID=8319 RepID=A0AAV7N848_PLEWA|nr:hypothetical protein NDU88_000498 [Pleurodeles waltl]
MRSASDSSAAGARACVTLCGLRYLLGECEGSGLRGFSSPVVRLQLGLLVLVAEFTIESRKAMYAQESANVPLTFQDVVACFSQQEWELLHTWQKDLYANLMKEIHQVLMTLGPVIATSVFSLGVKEKQDLCSSNDESADRQHSEDHSPRMAGISSPVSSNVKNEAGTCSVDHRDSEMKGHIKKLTSDPVASVISQSPAEENRAHFQQKTDDEQRKTANQSENRSMHEKDSLVCLHEKHQRVHQSESRFSCSEREKIFNQKVLLADHQRIHTVQKRFPCTECEKSFTKISSLLEHQSFYLNKRDIPEDTVHNCERLSSDNKMKHQSGGRMQHEKSLQKDIQTHCSGS